MVVNFNAIIHPHLYLFRCKSLVVLATCNVPIFFANVFKIVKSRDFVVIILTRLIFSLIRITYTLYTLRTLRFEFINYLLSFQGNGFIANVL